MKLPTNLRSLAASATLVQIEDLLGQAARMAQGIDESSVALRITDAKAKARAARNAHDMFLAANKEGKLR